MAQATLPERTLAPAAFASAQGGSRMNMIPRPLSALALLGALSVAILVAPVPARAATLATDGQDIPAFVLDHVELTPGARLRAG
jgi:hypothetical protein